MQTVAVDIYTMFPQGHPKKIKNINVFSGELLVAHPPWNYTLGIP